MNTFCFILWNLPLQALVGGRVSPTGGAKKDHPVDAYLILGYEPPSREEREEEIYALLGGQQGIRLRAITLQWHVESDFNGKS